MAATFDDALLDTEGASKLLKIPASTLVKWRSTGQYNVPYIKIGHAVRYRRSDLLNYIDGHRHDTKSNVKKVPKYELDESKFEANQNP